VPVGQARFTRRVEDFECSHCQRYVTGNGYTNHCPSCLWSRHVDINPGDRLATCGGMMRPIGAVMSGPELTVIHECEDCGHRRPNKVTALDNESAVRELLAIPVPDATPKAQPSKRSRKPER
jgi:hypothetical protein